ncbi:MAG: hypothetical protein Q7V17_13820 [Afipia sp.]|nr:hypothetical protein [Afipia sp.]
MFETNWRADMQDVSAAINETMGEPVTITPATRKPNFQSTPDFARSASAIAVFSWKSRSIFKEQTGKNGHAGPLMEVESREPTFSFTTSQLPFPLWPGYRIARCAGHVFEITAVEPDGVARTVVHVVQLGRPPAIG